MRRPLWFRALIALWGVWFTTALSEPAAFHTCPMHGDHTAHQAPGAASHHDMEAGSAPAQHKGHSSNECTCFGQCCCAGPVAVPADAPSLPIGEVRPANIATPAANDRAIVRWDYAQPFANGPPAIAAESL